jgi:hypothetical protein
MEFNQFAVAISEQFDKMKAGKTYRSGAPADLLWDTYLGSFPEGSNPIYKERTEHDCQCCKQFVRQAGGMLSIVDGKMVSIWDVNVGGVYQVVADAMSKLCKEKGIVNVFASAERAIGKRETFQDLGDGEVKKWSHFGVELPNSMFCPKDSIGTHLGSTLSSYQLLVRALQELSVEAISTTLELIDQNSIYRGEEHKNSVVCFLVLKTKFDKLKNSHSRSIFAWEASVSQPPSVIRIRNTAIGSLLVDLSDGSPLDRAVASFEAKVAPTNYKRPTALITKGMIDKAQKTIESLGLLPSLGRRYAVIDDITINNVLHANREARAAMNVFDQMKDEAAIDIRSFSKVEEIGIEYFIENILPKSETVELLVENRHKANIVSLIAPVDPDAKRLFKWENNFSWAYSGDVADSMKERVKEAGGNIDGIMRFSLSWNENNSDQNIDLDAHGYLPCGTHVYYARKNGMLDVDNQRPGSKVAVENICFHRDSNLDEGRYDFTVNNYSSAACKGGFTAELEIDGEILSFEHNGEVRGGQTVDVASVKYSRKDGFKVTKSMPTTTSSKTLCGIQTHTLQKVKVIMNSPNHWDGFMTGNKHYFFMLEGCTQEGPARGFFNEFLSQELDKHRKVFEVLGSKMKTEPSDQQLTGLGFSSTQRNHVFCKVTGAFSRTIKLTF